MIPFPFDASRPISRRQWIQQAAIGSFACTLAHHWTQSGLHAEEQKVVEETPSNLAPRMQQEYYVAQLQQIASRRELTFEGLQSREDAEQYIQSIRQKIRICFGPLPEKTPLLPRITGILERDTYTIEKVIFESRPGYLVTANLYLPRDRTKPKPGVIGSCGHSVNGKAGDAYQSFAQGLARQGYVVLIYDPIGQGERVQFLDAQLKPTVGSGVAEHLLVGNQQSLVGEFLGTWRAWDGIRALDYLLSRPEVDPRHLGITGNSGGGTLTTWLSALEDRWTMSAPSCFVTSFKNNLENELPADTEQCPPRALEFGLDHEDFLAALAPKPVILLAQEKDYFDVRGTEQAYQRLRHLYELLGHTENIALFIGPQQHGYSVENRSAMYRWFNQQTHLPQQGVEPQLTIETDQELACTPQGQVVTLGSKTIPDFTREISQVQKSQRKPLTPETLVPILEEQLHLPQRNGTPSYRILRPVSKRGYPQPHASLYAIETEPGILCFTYRLSPQPHYARPDNTPQPALLFVPHQSSDSELRNSKFVRRELAPEKSPVIAYSVDLRGVGESQPNTCGVPPFSPYGSDFFYAAHALMLGRPMVSQRTYDLLRVLDWLVEQGHSRIHLVAQGWGTIPATFAALLHHSITQVTLKNYLPGYSDLAESDRPNWPLSAFLPGVLKHFDLPDCYRSLESKHLKLLSPWSPQQKES